MHDKNLNQRKIPLGGGIFGSVNLFSTSTITNSNRLVNPQRQSTPQSVGSAGAVAVLHSLSNATLNHTYNNTTSYYLVNSLTKIYPDKMKFFAFKHPFKSRTTDQKSRSVVDLSLTTTESGDIPRTIEQEMDSFKSSIARTRRELNDLVDCNDFDKFATLTFDPKRHPLCNDREYAKNKIVNWLDNQKRLYGPFNYILVSERQDNGNIHFHALLGGFTGKYHATNTRGTGDTKRQCYKIDSWEKNNGFADMEDIQDKHRLSNYLLKYITKDIDSSLIGKNSKRYYSNKGLSRPQKVYNQAIETYYQKEIINEYENDFVRITTFSKI